MSTVVGTHDSCGTEKDCLQLGLVCMDTMFEVSPLIFSRISYDRIEEDRQVGEHNKCDGHTISPPAGHLAFCEKVQNLPTPSSSAT